MTFAAKPASGTPIHLVVWIDHQSARLITLAHASGETVIRNNFDAGGHVHHKAGTVGAGHDEIDDRFLASVMDAIGEAREILIVGPADTKNVLRKFLTRHAPSMGARIMAVEAMDHASEGEIRAFGAEYFLRADPMLKSHR